MQIKNKHVVVTGANGGIGKSFALMCAKENAILHLVVRTHDENLIKEVKQAGASEVFLWKADLSLFDEIESLLKTLNQYPIAILFNNAGLLTGGLIEEQPLADIYKMLQVNVNALIHLSRGMIPGMIKRESGKIINNSSVSAIMHFPCASTYAASKAAVMAFTDCIRLELKDKGVTTLLLITPGIKTKMFDNIATLYSKNIKVPEGSITSDEYALRIKKAILSDDNILTPPLFSSTGMALSFSANFKGSFEKIISSQFTRK